MVNFAAWMFVCVVECEGMIGDIELHGMWLLGCLYVFRSWCRSEWFFGDLRVSVRIMWCFFIVFFVI